MWQPADYVLHGTYCDTDAIRNFVSKIRIEQDLELAILLVAQGPTVFESLLLVSGAMIETRSGIEPMLRTTLRQRRAALGRNIELRTLLQAVADDVSVPLDTHSWSFFSAPIDAPVIQQEKAALDQDLHSNLTCILGLLGKTSRSCPIHVSPLELGNLLTMVAASAPVQLHRDLFEVDQAESLSRALEVELGATVRDTSRSTNEEPQLVSGDLPAQLPNKDLIETNLAKATLNTAIRLTKSTRGCIYLATSRKRLLRIAAFSESELYPDTIRMLRRPSKDLKDLDRLIAWTYRHQRPRILNEPVRAIDSGAQMGLDQPDTFRVAMPINAAELNTAGERIQPGTVGVLLLERTEVKNNSHYTYRDILVLRALLAKFSLWLSNALFSETLSVLTQLTRRGYSRHELGALPFEGSPVSPMQAPDIPQELYLADDAVSAVLKAIFNLTRSCTATVRILCLSGEPRLVRFCACPDEARSGAHQAIPVKSQRSINAEVARTGRVFYVADVEKDGVRFLSVQGRGGVRSELCLPIFLAGRLIGTMNLESHYLDAYAGSVQLALAIAEQVGLVLHRQQRMTEDIIWSRAAHGAVNVHKLLNCSDQLLEIARDVSLGSTIAKRIGEISHDVLAAVDWAATPGYGSSMDLADVVQSIIEELHFTEHILWRRALRIGHTLPPLRVLATRQALTSVLQNAYTRAAGARGEFCVRLYPWETVRGGTQYVSIGVETTLSSSLPEKVVAALYRVPIRGRHGDRLHIGAFAAGASMRAIGGDVYLHVSGPRRMQTVIEVPVSR